MISFFIRYKWPSLDLSGLSALPLIRLSNWCQWSLWFKSTVNIFERGFVNFSDVNYAQLKENKHFFYLNTLNAVFSEGHVTKWSTKKISKLWQGVLIKASTPTYHDAWLNNPPWIVSIFGHTFSFKIMYLHLAIEYFVVYSDASRRY